MTALTAVLMILQTGEPVVLAEDVFIARALDSATILYSNSSGSLFTVNVSTGETDRWYQSWSPEDDGWIPGNFVYEISVSPAGDRVCVAQAVLLPDTYVFPEEMSGMRSVLTGILSGNDGSGALPVFVGAAAGGGPTYAFTEDSKLLVGSPMFACEPTPEGYGLFALSERNDWPVEPFNAIETETGKPVTLCLPDISDGFSKCPGSDCFRIENNSYEAHSFASFHEPEILGTWETPDGLCSRYYGWVSADAVLLTVGENQLLLFTDGTTRPAGFPFRLIPEVWLPDGSYLYTKDDRTDSLHHAHIDWNSFEVSDHGVFSFPEEMRGKRLIPMPDSHGIFCVDMWSTGSLLYYPLPD